MPVPVSHSFISPIVPACADSDLHVNIVLLGGIGNTDPAQSIGPKTDRGKNPQNARGGLSMEGVIT